MVICCNSTRKLVQYLKLHVANGILIHSVVKTKIWGVILNSSLPFLLPLILEQELNTYLLYLSYHFPSPFLSSSVVTMLVRTAITSGLDYCATIFTGFPPYILAMSHLKSNVLTVFYQTLPDVAHAYPSEFISLGFSSLCFSYIDVLCFSKRPAQLILGFCINCFLCLERTSACSGLPWWLRQ